MSTKNRLLLAYYGDDFTGSTDALEFLTRAGIKTVLFISAPTVAQLERYKGLQAIGVAGVTRAMQPAEMETELSAAFAALKDLGAPHVHYKVCSTFDSSPHIGNIGKAMEVGLSIFKSKFIPLLVAAPILGRYCMFGNLFARMGIGSKGEIYRLDRHPSMSKHPVTPATESDLLKHLAKQTGLPSALVDILTVDNEAATIHKTNTLITEYKVVLFDALKDEQLLNIGSALDSYAVEGEVLFSVGSSGIEMALGKHWNDKGLIKTVDKWQPAGRSNAMLVLSGSCSPVTAAQIDYALANGFAEVALDTTAVAKSKEIDMALKPTVVAAVTLLKAGKPVIIHTSRGADDERINATYQQLSAQGLSEGDILAKTAYLYGTALGKALLSIVAQTTVNRLIIAGGDTSGYVARAIGVEAVEMIAPLSPGAPLCRAYAPGSAIDGVEINFKGGQVGGADYFVKALEGNTI